MVERGTSTDDSDQLWVRRLPLIVAAAVVVVLAATTAALMVPGVRAWWSLATGYSLGDTFEVPVGPEGAARSTLVVLARASCPTCRRAAPVLAELVREARRSGLAQMLVVPAPVNQANTGFGLELGLEAEQIVAARMSDLRVAEVPTVLIVDLKGRVVQQWSGGSIVDRRAELLSEIARKPGA
jgi:thiol-disulfide isomerase/thioredoxin